jgi:cell division inhibitor SepF
MRGEDVDDVEVDEKNNDTVNDKLVSSTETLRKQRENSKVVSIHANIQMQVVIMYPVDVEDAALVCDYINQNKTCVVNLEGVDTNNAQRVADFLSGAAYVINGDIQRISANIFIVAPANVTITGEFKEELKANGLILPWASSSAE